MHNDLIAAQREWGIAFDGAVDLLKPEYKNDYGLAMDAQPTLVTTSNSGIPQFLTTFVDPDILRILTAKNKAAEILGEVRKGSFVDRTAIFPMVEQTGQVASYGDYNTDGHAGANMNFPVREAFNYQVIVEYGELEIELVKKCEMLY